MPKQFLTPPFGQNLVELTLVLPFALIMIFAVIEIGHYWQTTETVKSAAMDGAYTAANVHNATVGTTQLQNRLSTANISFNAASSLVTESLDQSTYTATVTATYHPLFGGMSLPSLSGNLTIIPATVPITYQQIKAIALY